MELYNKYISVSQTCIFASLFYKIFNYLDVNLPLNEIDNCVKITYKELLVNDQIYCRATLYMTYLIEWQNVGHSIVILPEHFDKDIKCPVFQLSKYISEYFLDEDKNIAVYIYPQYISKKWCFYANGRRLKTEYQDYCSIADMGLLNVSIFDIFVFIYYVLKLDITLYDDENEPI